MGEVRLESVSKVFKETVAVDGISLTIYEGEFFSLLGPSGCGKTTTLRMIGGFEEPTSGRVFLSGRDVTGVPPYKRDVNTVFQSYALFPHLDVGENIAYGLKRRKVPAADISARVSDMLDLVDLPGLASRKPSQLSGGQQQRVALARALVNQPQVLLLDEPLGALDLKLRKQMQIELKRIQSEVGITFIYVTHDQEEAMTMSDRIAVMSDGRLEQVGPPQRVYESPETDFVAGFLGASNLLDGVVESVEGGRARVALDDGSVVAMAASRLPAGDGRVRVGVRPEKLHISAQTEPDKSPADGATNAIAATVRVSTYTGVSTSYECATAGGASIVVYLQNLDADPAPIATGSQVRISWQPEHTFAVEAGPTPERRE